MPYEEYFRGFEEVCAPSAAGRTGARCTTATPSRSRPAYPRFDDFLAVRDKLDPRPGLRQRRTTCTCPTAPTTSRSRRSAAAPASTPTRPGPRCCCCRRCPSASTPTTCKVPGGLALQRHADDAAGAPHRPGRFAGAAGRPQAGAAQRPRRQRAEAADARAAPPHQGVPVRVRLVPHGGRPVSARSSSSPASTPTRWRRAWAWRSSRTCCSPSWPTTAPPQPTRFEAINRGWISITRPWHLVSENTGLGDPPAATAEKGRKLMDVLVERLGELSRRAWRRRRWMRRFRAAPSAAAWPSCCWNSPTASPPAPAGRWCCAASSSATRTSRGPSHLPRELLTTDLDDAILTTRTSRSSSKLVGGVDWARQAVLAPAGGRQGRGDRQQGAAGDARRRDLRRRPPARPGHRLRGQRRRRRADHRRPDAEPGRQPDPVAAGHPQRHLQLHPDRA